VTKLNIPHPKTSKEELVKKKIKIQILKIEWALLGGHQIVWSLWYHTKLPTLLGGHHLLGAAYLDSQGNLIVKFGPVNPTMHASPQML